MDILSDKEKNGFWFSLVQYKTLVNYYVRYNKYIPIHVIPFPRIKVDN